MTTAEAPLQLLYVEGDPTYRTEVAAAFEPHWEVTTVETAVTAAETADSAIDCVISAAELPDSDGIALFHSLADALGSTPFVLFAQTADGDLVREAFRAGITDVIYKQRSTGQPTAETAGPAAAAASIDTDRADRPDNCIGTARKPLSNCEAVTESDETCEIPLTETPPPEIPPLETPEPETLPTETQPPETAAGAPHLVESVPITDGVMGLQNCLTRLFTDRKPDLTGTALDVSRSLMSAADDEMEMKIEWALESLAAEIGATHCLFYQYDTSENMLRRRHGWIAESAMTSDSDPLQGDSKPTETESISSLLAHDAIRTTEFPGFCSHLQQFEAVCCDPQHTAAADIDTLAYEACQTGSLLALPIVIEWELSGTLVIVTETPRHWSETVQQQLKAVGELISHVERRYQRRTALERQNEQLEQFASVISHDLQNPLNVVAGYLDLTIETGDIGRLEPACNATDRMKALLEDLLMLAREGREVGETEPVHIDSIVSDAWNSVATHDATLLTEGLDALEPVSADPTRLKQAFENLFNNAITHVGGTVSLTVTGADNQVIVADDGPGIPPAERTAVFEYGHTGANGTGLGLSIVRTIIEGHGWTIRVDESECGGAAFVIDFDE